MLVLCLLLLTACANTSQTTKSQMDMGQMQMETITPAGQVHASPTNAVTVQITLSDFRIALEKTTFVPGVPYHFLVTNTGKIAHELMLLSSTMKTMDMRNMSMNDIDSMALTSLGQVKPGETKPLDYTFVLTTTGSSPEFACLLPGHYAAGMHVDVALRQQQA